MSWLLTKLSQTFCKHEYFKRTDSRTGTVYGECIECLHTTPGVKTGPGTLGPDSNL